MIILSWKATSLKRSGRPPSHPCDTHYIGPFKLLLFLIHGHDMYEYIPKLETLTIRMPSWLHVQLLALITEDLQDQLRDTNSGIKTSSSALSWKELSSATQPTFIRWHALATFDRETSKSPLSDARFHESVSRSHIPGNFTIGLHSVCTFDKVSLQLWPLYVMLQAKLIKIPVDLQRIPACQVPFNLEHTHSSSHSYNCIGRTQYQQV